MGANSFPSVKWVDGKRDHMATRFKDDIAENFPLIENQESVRIAAVEIEKHLDRVRRFREGLGFNLKDVVQVVQFESPNHGMPGRWQGQDALLRGWPHSICLGIYHARFSVPRNSKQRGESIQKTLTSSRGSFTVIHQVSILSSSDLDRILPKSLFSTFVQESGKGHSSLLQNLF